MTSDTETGIQRCSADVRPVEHDHLDDDAYEPCGDPVMVIDGELKHVDVRCGFTFDMTVGDEELPSRCGYLVNLHPKSVGHDLEPKPVERGHVPEVR